MSQLQRIIVRMGLASQVPALKDAELGWDLDTSTLRVGNESPNPHKVMSTGSIGAFDYPNVDASFKSISALNISGVNLGSMVADPGILVSLGNGEFLARSIQSYDNSVVITNGNGVDGVIDLSVQLDSLNGPIADIRQSINDLTDRIDATDNQRTADWQYFEQLISLSGRPLGSINLGAFSGSTIPDNVSIKTALQSLETKVEAVEQMIDFSSITLSITNHDNDSLDIEISTGSSITLPGAIPTKSGLMSSDDKIKLDFVQVTGSVDLDALTQTVSTNSIDIDALEDTAADLVTRVTALELSSAPTTTAYYSKGTELWFSEETSTVGIIDPETLQAFVVEVDRVGSVTGEIIYDAVTVNGITILPAEITIHSITVSITIFKSSIGRWYVMKSGLLCELLSDVTPVQYEISSSNNSVRVFELLAI